jgi:hypothetical protein
MKKLVILFSLVVLAGCCLMSCRPAPEEGGAEAKPGEEAEPGTVEEDGIDMTFIPEAPEGGRVDSAGGWHLVIEYRAKGTRSEGQTGTLYRGREVIKGKKGDVVDTPLGEMRHYGDRPEHLWSPTGWNYADTSKRKNSWDNGSDQ